MAERGGFEPPVPLLGVHTISSRAPSTARSPLRLRLLRYDTTGMQIHLSTFLSTNGGPSTSWQPEIKRTPNLWLVAITTIVLPCFLETSFFESTKFMTPTRPSQ